jgi:hypothetical protein
MVPNIYANLNDLADRPISPLLHSPHIPIPSSTWSIHSIVRRPPPICPSFIFPSSASSSPCPSPYLSLRCFIRPRLISPYTHSPHTLYLPLLRFRPPQLPSPGPLFFIFNISLTYWPSGLMILWASLHLSITPAPSYPLPLPFLPFSHYTYFYP